jgi:hypothetical protein
MNPEYPNFIRMGIIKLNGVIFWTNCWNLNENSKAFSFSILMWAIIVGNWVYWLRRHWERGVVVHLGIRVRTPWRGLLVGYTPALAPLWRHLTPVLERELGRVAEGRFRRYWDRSNIPQRKRRMKCGIMGNWRCISDRAKCPYLRSHSVGLNALFRRVEWTCVASWVLALCGLVEYPQWSL